MDLTIGAEVEVEGEFSDDILEAEVVEVEVPSDTDDSDPNDEDDSDDVVEGDSDGDNSGPGGGS